MPKSLFVIIEGLRISFMDLTDAIVKFRSLLAKSGKGRVSKAEVGNFIAYLQLLKHSQSGIEERLQHLRSEIARLEDKKRRTQSEARAI